MLKLSFVLIQNIYFVSFTANLLLNSKISFLVIGKLQKKIYPFYKQIGIRPEILDFKKNFYFIPN